MTKIDFIYFDAGGGHRSAATALKSVIDAQNGTGSRHWDVRMVNLQEVLDSMDVFKKVTGIRLEDIYNKLLAKGWTFGSAQGLKFMHVVIRMYHSSAVQLLSRHWLETKPDMVVSLVPNFNRALYQSLRNSLPEVPYVTILTDMADFPPHFWIEPEQDQHFICGTEKAVKQALSAGHARERVHQASGMILRPKFYEPLAADRTAERARLGLDPSAPTGVVLFGGQGSSVMLEIAERLRDIQLILICGRNEKLAARLRAQRSAKAHFVEGFTQEIPAYMHMADFFIGKPGPGSISEAVAMKLPVIVERNAWTLAQERYNSEWILEKGAGLVVENFRGIHDAVDELFGALDKYRANVSKIQNRAVFEIPEILARILTVR